MFFEKKKEDVFFTMFKDFADTIATMGENFSKIINDYDNVERLIADLKITESECDTKAHNILNKLNESFITPFDREDIYEIVNQLDDIADFIEESANMLLIYDIKELRSDAVELGNIIVDSTKKVQVLFQALPDYKKHQAAADAAVEINRLEDLGDEIYRRALSKLFKDEKDPIKVIKWKDIYEDLENTLDTCEHLADLVEGVMMKNA